MQKNTEIRGNTMGYKINYEKNIEMQLKSEAIIQECLLTLDTVEDVLNKIKTTEAVKCKAKNALNAYMDDVIINKMIAVTREAIQWYVWEQTCYCSIVNWITSIKVDTKINYIEFKCRKRLGSFLFY